MSRKMSVELTTRRGFPVIVKGSICRAEPDVGIMSDYLDDIEVLTLAGKSVDFLHLTEKELEELEEKFFEGIN